MSEPEKPFFNDWSSRHVRLKYQMFASATVALLTSKEPFETVSLFGMLFEQSIGQIAVSCFTFSFGLFSLISFIIRSRLESSLWSMDIQTSLNASTEIKSLDIEGLMFSFSEALTDFQQKLSRASVSSRTTRGDAISAIKEFENGRLPNTIVIVKYGVNRVERKLNLIRVSLLRHTGIASKILVVEESFKRFSELEEDLTAQMLDFDRSVRSNQDVASNMDFILDKLLRMVAVIDGLQESVSSVGNDVIDIEKALVKFRRDSWLENYLFSVYFPTSISIALLAVAIFNIASDLILDHILKLIL